MSQDGKDKKVFAFPAGPSAPPLVFGSNNFGDFAFTTGPNPERDHALERLARKETELEKSKEDYHNILVDRDRRIDELQETLRITRLEVTNIRKEIDNAERDVKGHQSTARDATEAKEKAESELKTQKGNSDHARELHEKLHKENIEQSKKIKTFDEVVRKFKERISSDAATLQALHKQIDDLNAQNEELQTANDNLVLQQETTANDVAQATEEFEHMFKDLGSELDLNSYVGHVRDLLSTGQLKRKDSTLSLERPLSTQKSDQDLNAVQSPTLQDQLAAADDSGSEHSVPAGGDAEDDEDDTLMGLGLGSTWTEHDYFVRLQDQEEEIGELKKRNEALQRELDAHAAAAASSADAKPPTGVNDSNFDLSNIEAVAISPIEAKPNSTQPLSKNNKANAKPEPEFDINHYEGVETPPSSRQKRRTKKALKAQAGEAMDTTPFTTKIYPSVSTKPIKPAPAATAPASRPAIRKQVIMRSNTTPTFSDLWRSVPFFYKVLLSLLVSFWAAIWISTVNERNIWLADNDMTHRQLLRMGTGGRQGWFESFITTVEVLLDVDRRHPVLPYD